MNTLKLGDTVTVDKGWSYYDINMSKSLTSDGTVKGTIAKQHEHPGTFILHLSNGHIASAAKSGMTKASG